MTTDQSKWKGKDRLTRVDGLRIERAADGYEIVPAEVVRARMRLCPCCSLPILTARAARVVADKEFPVVSKN
jgi:hypothetical protein